MDRSFAYDSGWLKSVERLEAFEQRQVAEARDQYLADPSYPGLKFEKVQGACNRLRTIRASEELRILLACEGPVTVFLRAGHHDPIYDMAPRVRYVVPRAGDAGCDSRRESRSFSASSENLRNGRGHEVGQQATHP